MLTRPFERRAYILAILAVCAVAAGLRFWRLDAVPPGFHFDESFEALEAWRMAHNPGYRPLYLPGNFGVSVAFPYLTAVAFRISEQFGVAPGPLPMRAAAGTVGVLTVPVVMGLARELVLHGLVGHNQTRGWLPIALASGAALATMRWHVHFSRMGIEPILGALTWAAALWALLYAWRNAPQRPRRALLAAAVCGCAVAAAMYSYQGVWILPIIIAACGLTLALKSASRPALKRRLAMLAVGGLVAALLFAPLAWIFVQEPALLTTRPQQVIAGEGNTQTWGESILATLSMFVPFGQGDFDPRRNIPGQPALNWLWAVAFWTGAGAGLMRFRSAPWLMLWIGWLGLLAPGVISEYSPHYHRILAAAAPTAIFTGVGAWILYHGAVRLGRNLVSPRLTLRFALAFVAGLIIAAGAWDAHDYFKRWANRPDLYYAFDEGLWEIGQWSALRPEPLVFVSPRGEEHPTLAFAWQTMGIAGAEGRRAPVSFDGRHVFPIAYGPAAADSIYIAIEHEDFRTPLLIKDVFPEAPIIHTFRDRSGVVYGHAWHRRGDSAPARAPAFPINAQTVEGVRLRGYDLLPDVPHAGGIAYVQLYWEVEAAPAQNLTVFLHLVDGKSGEVMAGHDAQPGQGSLPTDRWQAGRLILDEHQMRLPADLPAGQYHLRVGLYPTGAPDNPAGPPIDLGTMQVTAEAP